MQLDIKNYHSALSDNDREICEKLYTIITKHLPQTTNKVWHAHPVWFMNDNPLVGYSKQKAGIKLMFWSGADFDEDDLTPGTGKFKDASIIYISSAQIKSTDLKRWLKKAIDIQWDYKNVVKNKGKLNKIK